MYSSPYVYYVIQITIHLSYLLDLLISILRPFYRLVGCIRQQTEWRYFFAIFRKLAGIIFLNQRKIQCE